MRFLTKFSAVYIAFCKFLGAASAGCRSMIAPRRPPCAGCRRFVAGQQGSVDRAWLDSQARWSIRSEKRPLRTRRRTRRRRPRATSGRQAVGARRGGPDPGCHPQCAEAGRGGRRDRAAGGRDPSAEPLAEAAGRARPPARGPLPARRRGDQYRGGLVRRDSPAGWKGRRSRSETWSDAASRPRREWRTCKAPCAPTRLSPCDPHWCWRG